MWLVLILVALANAESIYTKYKKTNCHGDGGLDFIIGTERDCELKCDELDCLSFTRTRDTGWCDFDSEAAISYPANDKDCFEATAIIDQDYNCQVGQGERGRLIWQGDLDGISCRELCDSNPECVGYDITMSNHNYKCRLFPHNTPRIGISGTDNRMYCADLFDPTADENGNGEGVEKETGDCTTVSFDTLNIGGKNRFHAVYIDCSGIQKIFSMKVDVEDMLGIHNCDLINDWQYSIGCPGGICAINHELTITLDICDVLAFIASAGAANLMAKLGTKFAQKVIGQGIRSMTNKQIRDAAGVFDKEIKSKTEKDKVKIQARGLCDTIATFIEQFLQCLGGRGGIIRDISKGIAVVLKVINKLFGYIMFKASFGTEFNLKNLSFQNWKVSFELKWKLGDLALIAKGILTGVARAVPSLRNGKSCDDWDTLANDASFYINFVPKVLARFVITCEHISISGISLKDLGDVLKNAAVKITSFMKKIGTAIGDVLQKIGEGFINFFTGRPSESTLNELKKVYHIQKMKCTIKCPKGWNHFFTSNYGCWPAGDMDWCKIRKTYWEFDENNERRELIEKPIDTLETDAALIESLNTLSDSQLEEFVATFSQEDIEKAFASAKQTHEEALEDMNDQVWVQTHEPLTAEEEEVKVEELCRALDQHISGAAQYEDEVEVELEEEEKISILTRLAELMAERERE